MRECFRDRIRLGFLALTMTLAGSWPIYGATQYWNDTSTTGRWTNAASWFSGVVPASNDVIGLPVLYGRANLSAPTTIVQQLDLVGLASNWIIQCAPSSGTLLFRVTDSLSVTPNGAVAFRFYDFGAGSKLHVRIDGELRARTRGFVEFGDRFTDLYKAEVFGLASIVSTNNLLAYIRVNAEEATFHGGVSMVGTGAAGGCSFVVANDETRPGNTTVAFFEGGSPRTWVSANAVGNAATVTYGTATVTIHSAASVTNSFAGYFRDLETTGNTAVLSIRKTGSNTQLFTGVASNSGPTSIEGGELRLHGDWTAAGRVETRGGTLGGTGSLGAVALFSGTLSPGPTIGALSASSLLLTGGTYRVDIANAVGTPGVDWDLVQVGGGTGAITNQASSANPVSLALHYSGSSLPGFYGTNAVSWRVIDAGSHSGFASNLFSVNTDQFAPSAKHFGSFAARNDAGNLMIDFTPSTNIVDLAVSISASTNVLLANEQVTYTVVVSNLSSHSSGFYTVTNALALPLSFVTGSAGVAASGQIVSWSLGNLAGGSSTILTFIATVAYSGSTQAMTSAVSTVVWTYFPDPVPGNNSASSSITTFGIPIFSPIALAILMLVVGYALWRNQRRSMAAHG